MPLSRLQQSSLIESMTRVSPCELRYINIHNHPGLQLWGWWWWLIIWWWWFTILTIAITMMSWSPLSSASSAHFWLQRPCIGPWAFSVFLNSRKASSCLQPPNQGLSSGCYWKKTEEIFVLKLQLQPSVKCSQCQLQLFTLIKVEVMRYTGPVFTQFTLYCEPHFQFRGCKFPETRRLSDPGKLDPIP